MKELSRHIEQLLLEHNCVIVPQLGGFVTQYVPARYVEAEKLFLPPARTVAFNPHLTLNDGLLVQSYMRVHSTTYQQTVRLIDRAVVDMKRRIQQDGSVNLHGIGTLSRNINGNYDFEPLTAGVSTPELYGLGAFSVEKVVREAHKPITMVDDGTYHFRINRELANYVAAAIVGILFYFAWALPEHRDAKELTVAASIIPQKAQNVRQAEAQKDASATEAATAVEAEVPTPVAAEEKAVETAEKKAEESVAEVPQNVAPEGSYTIVLATGVPQSGAEILVGQLSQAGFNHSEIRPYKRSKQVIYGVFSTEGEAREFLSGVRSQQQFKTAWVTRR